jgi:hypothetical protein
LPSPVCISTIELKWTAEVPHVELPPTRFAHERKRFYQQRIERLATPRPIPQREAELFDLVIAQGHVAFFERRDPRHQHAPFAKRTANQSP